MKSLSKELEGTDFKTIVGNALANPATIEDIQTYKYLADRAASKISSKNGMQSGKAVFPDKTVYWIYSWSLPYVKEDMPLLFVTGEEKEYIKIRETYLGKAS